MGKTSTDIIVRDADTFFDDTSEFDIPRIPEETWIHDNTYSNNGANPDQAAAEAGFPAGNDILWDVSAWNNTIDEPAARVYPYAPPSWWPDVLKKAMWQAVQILK